MHINVSGHHIDLTQGMRDAVLNRFSKVESHFPQLDQLSITLTVDKSEQKVDANTLFLGRAVSVQASDGDMYHAIADAAKKLNSALEHHKGARTKRRAAQH